METKLRLQIKINRSLNFLKGGIPLIINNIGLIILGFVFWGTATRFYNTTIIGVSTGIIPMIVIIGILSKLGLDFSFLRFISDLTEGQGKKFVIYSMIIGMVSSLLFSLFFCLLFFNQIFIKLFKNQLPLIFFFFIISSISQTIGLIEDGILIGSQVEMSILIKNLLFFVFRIPLLPILRGFGFVGVVAAWGIPSLAGALFGIIFIFKYLKIRVTNSNDLPLSIREFLGYSLANYYLSILQNAPGLLLPSFVLLIMGPKASATFYFSWMIANSLQLFPIIFSSVMVPRAVDKTKRRSSIMQCVLITFLFLFPTSLLLYVFAPSIMGIFMFQYMDVGIDLLRILIISSYGFAINTIYIYVQRVEKVLKPAIGLLTLLNVLTFGLGGFLLIDHRLIGLAIVWFFSNASLASLALISIYRRLLWQLK